MAAKIKKGDFVIVVAGKYKNQKGYVSSLIKRDKLHLVFISGVGFVKKHLKSNPDRGVTGGIVQKASPIHISNVAYFDPSLQKKSKIGFRVLGDGKKVRYLKTNNEIIDMKD